MLNSFFVSKSPRVQRAKEIYNVIRTHGEISKLELLQKTRIPSSTISRTIEDLLSTQLIEEYGPGESNGGRRPLLYRVKPNAYFLVGVDLSRTGVRIVLTDMTLNIIRETHFQITNDIEPELLVKKISDNIRSMIDACRIKKESIIGLGVGTVGLLDKKNGIVLDAAGFPAKTWENIPLKHLLEKELGIFTIVNNGVNAAALAEYWHELGKNYKSIVYVMVGIGLRCGIIADDKSVADVAGNEDLYGHIIVAFNGRQCYCGNRGCLEQYTSIPAMIQSFKEKLAKKSIYSQKYEPDAISWNTVCESVRKHESIGMDVVAEAALYLGTGLMNIINILNPRVIVLGGAAMNTCDQLYINTAAAAKSILPRKDNNILFTRGTFGENAVAVGSATLVLDYFLGKKVAVAQDSFNTMQG